MDDKLRTQLMKEYLDLRSKADAINEKMERAKKAFQESLGDIEEIHLGGLKVIYRYNSEVNVEAIKAQNSEVWVECLKEPEMNVPLFRKLHPELVEKFSVRSKTRPLKIVV